ncbi:Hypothetical predicted protein [Paramuricea clavata]|uniref:Uncharacterized protein n=1 Tax=Paramuricea clavata TaxID=317549 RepID=A0A7D9D716_PARCT|nr:Hypothetical predicted protein [Paramuricea clavata]
MAEIEVMAEVMAKIPEEKKNTVKTVDEKIMKEERLWKSIIKKKSKIMEEAKRIVEGESGTLSYNSDDEWFDDEDEDFDFTNSPGFFEKAWTDGLKERDDMQRGYLDIAQNKDSQMDNK